MNDSTDETVHRLLLEGVDSSLTSNEEQPPDRFFFIPSPQGLVPVIFWDYSWIEKNTSERTNDSNASG